LNRAWKICSDKDERFIEAKRIRAVLLRNNYPEHVLDVEIVKFIRNRAKVENLVVDGMVGDYTVPKVQRFISLPYVNKKSEEFGRRLRKLVNTTFPLFDLRVAFKATLEIGKLFSFKDKVN
jgi:hypothetical protein